MALVEAASKVEEGSEAFVSVAPDDKAGDDGLEVTAGKDVTAFRDYHGKQGLQLDRVREHYRTMRENQCVAFVERMEAKWFPLDKAEMTIWECFDALGDFVDGSDPDTVAPNLEHMLQTAEGIRAAGLPDWFQLTGLLHDLGKVMYKWGAFEDGQSAVSPSDPQWALGGDTWVVGCPIPDCTVYPELNAVNPDREHAVYGAGPTGCYEAGCGMARLRFAFGHDEYMYHVLKTNCPDFPEEGLAVIRYHSCYPWHTGGAYRDLMAPGDERLLEVVRRFNQFDLYTKADEEPDVEALRPYYQSLIDKYCPGKLRW